MTILDKIITEKKKEVASLRNQTFDSTPKYKEVKTLTEVIQAKDTMGIIAEIKRASPSKGMINEDVNPVKQALMYEKHGASAISVLTDTPFFKGTMDDLRAVREAVNIPILCKDFIIDSVQIDRAQAAGANIILLIAAALNDEQLQSLYKYAQEKQLEVLCEVHNEEEMERVLALDATLIGINNRDLKTFKVDLQTTNKLAKMITDTNKIIISESGIKTTADVEAVASAGAEVILIGETLMRASNLEHTLTNLQIPLTKERQ